MKFFVYKYSRGLLAVPGTTASLDGHLIMEFRFFYVGAQSLEDVF